MLYKHLRAKNCYVDYSALKGEKPIAVIPKKKQIILPDLNPAEIDSLFRYKKWMLQKRLSENTVSTYYDVTALFLKYVQSKKMNVITVNLIESFNYEYVVGPNKSISYQNQCINGIKKYLEYKRIPLGKMELQRPGREKRLPEVLSLEEVKRIFDATQNLKHKTLLSLIIQRD